MTDFDGERRRARLLPYIMQPMSTFDPDLPCKVHDRLNDKMINWRTGWAPKWRQFAKTMPDGTAWFDGLVLDGWEPMGAPI